MANKMNTMVKVDTSLAEEARILDESPLNRSNIRFSRLSMKIAKQILSSASDQPSLLEHLELEFATLAKDWNSAAGAGGSRSKPPFCCVEGVAYAINAHKIKSIRGEGHVMITVPFYCEFERGRPATDENPNGEESPIQKLEECIFLLSFNDNISMDLIFVNDVIAEKKDDKDGGGSAKLFKKSILDYVASNGLDVDLKSERGVDGGRAEGDFDSLTALDGRLRIRFTSCEKEASKDSKFETAEDKRRRMENRGEDGKLRERKGGAVLTGMELNLPENADPRRVVRCLVDGDSAHPVASYVGDAAYSILECNHTAYLGNLKHAGTCVSVVGEESGGATAGTQAKVQNRKLFFSGFIVPFLFPELALKYQYTGTTQLPLKAFRGDIDFGKAKLKTVQPNVDLGLLALLCSSLNANGGSIDSGPVTIRDNVASSTMTTDDLCSEWTKTYGPIFTSPVSLCRELKPTEFERLPLWLTKFIENMELRHYTTLFGEEASGDSDVIALFSIMEKYKGATDRDAVLNQLKTAFDKIFDA